MAILDVNFFSNKLMRQVTYKAVIPTEGNNDNLPFKTLYLLHGIMGNYNDWVSLTRITQLAAKFKIAVIMPSGDNAFYVDQKSTHNYYGEFIGSELVKETRKLFNLSSKREDTFIAGLSMGGYGALRNGLKYHQNFGAIAGLSSAFIQEQILNSTETADWHFSKRSYYEAVFGDLSKLKGSDMDIEALIFGLKNSLETLPNIYICCGTEDFLIEQNRKFAKFLEENEIEHKYVESSGVHDWRFWDEYIEKILYWLRFKQ